MSASALLIDDDQVFTQTLGTALQRRGYTVTAVNDEMDIDAAAACDYDHILLDLMLGDVSTIGRINGLCAAQPGARLIMLTGCACIPATVQAMRSGAVNLLAKPVGVREIVAAMEDDSGESEEGTPDTRPMGLKQVEWEYIQRVLAEHQGNVSAAALSLGMHRRTLQRKLEKRAPR